MKNFLAAVALAGLSTTVAAPWALAADMAIKAPMYSKAPVSNWGGFYAGVNAGWANEHNRLSTVVTPTSDVTLGVLPGVSEGLAALSSTPVPLGDKSGFIGGAQIGYNWQFNNIVAGLEADIQGISGPARVSSITTAAVVVGATVASNNSVSMSVTSLGTVRGRLGFLATPALLLYGTGGLAYGSVEAGTSVSQFGTNGFIGNGSASLSKMRAGWTAGAGFEWMFAKDWSTKVEYLHYDLGTANFSGVATSATIFVTPLYQTSVSSARFSGDVVRAGLNYHFNMPVLAKY